MKSSFFAKYRSSIGLATFLALNLCITIVMNNDIVFAGGLVLATAALIMWNPYIATSIVVAAGLLAGNIDLPRLFGVSSLTLCIGLAGVVLWGLRKLPRLLAWERFPWLTVLGLLVALSSFSGIDALRSLATPVAIAFASYQLVKTRPFLIYWSLGVAGLLHSSLGVAESLGHFSLAYTGWKDEAAADIWGVRRAASTIADPNYLAATLVCCFPGVWFLLRKLRLPLALGGWTLFSAAGLLTFSRTFIIAALVAGALIGIRSLDWGWLRRYVPWLALGISALVGVLLFSGLGAALLERFNLQDSSVNQRSIIQAETLKIFTGNWFNGIGLGQLEVHLHPLATSLVPLDKNGEPAWLPQTDPLNAYLLVAAETGVIGLLIVLGILAVFITRSYRLGNAFYGTAIALSVMALTLDLVFLLGVWVVMTYAMERGRARGDDGFRQIRGLMKGWRSREVRRSADILRA